MKRGDFVGLVVQVANDLKSLKQTFACQVFALFSWLHKVSSGSKRIDYVCVK